MRTMYLSLVCDSRERDSRERDDVCDSRERDDAYDIFESCV